MSKKSKTKLRKRRVQLNKSKGVTTGFYVREDNIELLEKEKIKQGRSLSWLVNNAIELAYGEG